MFDWDHYSNQPSIIRDKKLKREIYKKTLFDTLKLLFINISFLPFVILNYFIKKRGEVDATEIFCIGISLENETPTTYKRIKRLNIKNILIRFPLSKIKDIEKYKKFIEKYSEFEILINLIQDRNHILDKELLKKDLKTVFTAFEKVKEYQIGTTINRKKWAFFSVDEYLRFFEVAKKLRDEEFKNIKLIGSSVIDFEYHFTIRSLFNFYKVYYDRFSALLYVDRRGSPFNSQMGFDFYKKLQLLYSIVTISPKTSNTIYITETNWPISGTAPYAPTSEKECVSLEDYSYFMVAYYLIALASKTIDRVYWHQLDAKGYGLVDHLEDEEYPAFLAYKTMVTLLKNKNMIKFDIESEIKVFEFEDIKVFYSENIFSKEFIKEGDLDIYANKYKSGKVIYRWMTC